MKHHQQIFLPWVRIVLQVCAPLSRSLIDYSLDRTRVVGYKLGSERRVLFLFLLVGISYLIILEMFRLDSCVGRQSGVGREWQVPVTY